MRYNETVKLHIFLLSNSKETHASLYTNSLIGVLLFLEEEYSERREIEACFLISMALAIVASWIGLGPMLLCGPLSLANVCFSLDPSISLRPPKYTSGSYLPKCTFFFFFIKHTSRDGPRRFE
jgi:hypothetical protein